MNKRIALMGTCNNSTWRDYLIPMLDIEFFNPVVEDWTPECMENEILQRQTCDYVLYTITPEMTGVYSIAEVVDDSNKRPHKTIMCILNDSKDGSTFSKHQTKSLTQVGKMVEENGGVVFTSLIEVANYVNHL
jgi:hypothetical protein